MGRFAEEMKRHQLDWALGGGVPRDYLEVRNGRISWVLKKEHRDNNLFEPSWWRFIAGHEHRWARALNSSQCFAVNLFAPAAMRSKLAKAILYTAAGITLPDDAVVEITFEHTPKDAPSWLGEKGQPTQVDVFFTATAQETLGYLVVEVKLTESGFGSCRGPNGRDKDGKGNPHPERCREGVAAVAHPQKLCWLAASEGRQYWNIITQSPNQFDFSCLSDDDACPFRDGLYQLLRNYALARALVAKTDATWAFITACVHPKNSDVYHLEEEVAGHRDAIAAFRQLAGNNACRVLNPQLVVSLSEREYPELMNWAQWMRARYLLEEKPIE